MISIAQGHLEDLTEKLAAIEHERWSHWQSYMHSKCKNSPDGSLIIPPELAEHWNRQMSTPYNRLAMSEKESDRAQVQRYLPLILETLGIIVANKVTK